MAARGRAAAGRRRVCVLAPSAKQRKQWVRSRRRTPRKRCDATGLLQTAQRPALIQGDGRTQAVTLYKRGQAAVDRAAPHCTVPRRQRAQATSDAARVPSAARGRWSAAADGSRTGAGPNAAPRAAERCRRRKPLRWPAARRAGSRARRHEPPPRALLNRLHQPLHAVGQPRARVRRRGLHNARRATARRATAA